MNETDTRDAKGRFLSGGKPGPGRPPSSRNKLAESFIADLRDAWNEHGARALAECARDEPAQFVRVVASLMPRDINLNVGVDVAEFASKFNAAVALLGNEPPPPKHRIRPLRGQPLTIEHDDGR